MNPPFNLKYRFNFVDNVDSDQRFCKELTIITEDSFIEIFEALLLLSSLIPCVLYARKSRGHSGKFFWIGTALTFILAIRRELSFIPDILVPADFLFLGQSYNWWEDYVLLVLTLTALFSWIYSWRYIWCLMKQVSKTIYIATFSLILLQYLAENQIGFGHISGNIVEELCENIIYLIAFFYLLRFTVDDFNRRFLVQNTKA